jgi:dolichol-phosphate mannosyltransferase
MKDFIIIPTYNERNNIAVLLDKIFSLYPAINVLVVDDNSPDGTGNVVRELRLKFPNLQLRERSGKLGLASAYTESIDFVLKQYPDVRAIITMDADSSHDPIVIASLLRELSAYDLILGSRYIAGGRVKNWQLWRILLSYGGNLYARLISGIPIRDLTTGYQCFRADLLRKEQLRNITANGFAFLMELKMFAYSLNARILEVPIVFKNRVEGESKISNHIIYEGLIVPWLLRKRMREIMRKK